MLEVSDSSDSEEEKVSQVNKERGSSESSDDENTQEQQSLDIKKKETLSDVVLNKEKMATSDGVPLPPQPRRKRFVPKYEVDGVHKLELSEETQILVEIVIGTHVSSQYPWKLVQKSKIIESIELGGEQSHFFPFKEEIEAYEEDLVLMGYIPDESKDEDEFYICVTKESRDHCTQQSEKFIRRQEKKLEKAVQRKPRPWIPLGSEAEIKSILPINTRPLMEVEIEATFPRVYQPSVYKVRDTYSCRDGMIELTPYRQKFYNVYRRRVDCGSQAASAKLDKMVQTILRYPKNMWTQTITDSLGSYDPMAAGDKNDLDQFFDEDVESSSSGDEEKKKAPVDDVGLEAYRKAFLRMRRASYQKTMTKFMIDKSTEMDSIVELNTVMDIYNNDYPNLVPKKAIDIYDSMKFDEYVCFTDVRAKDKYVSCAVFHPMWSGIVAICYSDGAPNVMKYLGTRPDPISRAVYGLNPVLIWSHIDSLIPKLYLECTREVKVLAFCPFDENILIGGCVNGQVVVWDLKNKLENVESIEALSETREKYRIAMNAHMGWMKPLQDKNVVPATAMSNLMTSHYAPITAIKWISPNFMISPTGKSFKVEDERKSLMFLTGSEDGTILIWNLSPENVSFLDNKKIKKSKRVLKRPSGLMVDFSPYKMWDRNLAPSYKLILGVAGRPQTLPVCSMACDAYPVKYIYSPRNSGTGRKYFAYEILPQVEIDFSSIIYCGSQHGELRKVSWEGHAFNTGEVVNSEYCEIKYSCSIHDGIVNYTARNPFLKHIILTVGGKIFAIWSDKMNDRPLLWKKRNCRLTDAVWSLYKPSLLFITTSEGNVETWDLLLRSDEPIAVQTVSGTMLTSVNVHTLPLTQNLIGVSDLYGSFRMFLCPPIFMIENSAHVVRMEHMIDRELKVKQSFLSWQNEWMKNNPQILLELKRKEGALLAEKEEEKRKLREEDEKKLEEEAEARKLARMRVIGPEERWQKIIQKLIERTIAVKKRINRAELIEHEKPLRELEAQRLEKERRMLDIMKNQKTIFNDTVAILFPEAIQKPTQSKTRILIQDKEVLKNEYFDDYMELKKQAAKMVRDNPYKVAFNWDATVAEGKERRQALNAYEDYINMHRNRLIEEIKEPSPYTSANALKKLSTKKDTSSSIQSAKEESLQS